MYILYAILLSYSYPPPHLPTSTLPTSTLPTSTLPTSTPTHSHTFSQPHLPSTPHHGQVKNASETHHPTLPFFGNSLSLFWLLFLVHLTCTTEIEGRDERCSQSQSQSQSQFFYLSRTCSVLTSIVPWSKRSSHLTQTYNSFVHRNQEPSRNSAGNPNELSLASSGSILVLFRAAHRQTARTAAYDRNRLELPSSSKPHTKIQEKLYLQFMWQISTNCPKTSMLFSHQIHLTALLGVCGLLGSAVNKVSFLGGD
ncbi:uncharacterized protein YALI1_F15357g [Yarrowia lipolytica]|uniref:Uncharacterized protein n=1 Tax=Yarrowia lipolytica TaxID=4952 RepID=A0A1D8NMX8_YARLL|nr:hypothetical protein YALI1_F15357g [Yarrowia lipolytica]